MIRDRAEIMLKQIQIVMTDQLRDEMKGKILLFAGSSAARQLQVGGGAAARRLGLFGVYCSPNV